MQNSLVKHIPRLILLDRNTHVTSIASFATIPLVLADALINTQASIRAALTRPLAVTTLLALAAALAAGLGGEVVFIVGELVLEIDGRGDGRLARL